MRSGRLEPGTTATTAGWGEREVQCRSFDRHVVLVAQGIDPRDPFGDLRWDGAVFEVRAADEGTRVVLGRQGHQPLQGGLVVQDGVAPGEQHAIGARLGEFESLWPFIAAAVEIHDPARLHARDYKEAFAARLTETAREAGAVDPEQLGEQLALLLEGASARNRVLDSESSATAAAIAAVLVDNAIPSGARLGRVDSAEANS